MDKFNILEYRTYDENYKFITEYLKGDEYRILFEIKKCINRNSNKIRYILGFFKKGWDNKFNAIDSEISRKLFQAFIISRNRWNVSETFSYLKCYDICIDSERHPMQRFCSTYMRNFSEVAPDYPWENRIKECLRHSWSGNSIKIEELKKICIKKIRKSLEMKRFLEALDNEHRWMSDERKMARKYNRKIINKLLLLINKTKSEQTEL